MSLSLISAPCSHPAVVGLTDVFPVCYSYVSVSFSHCINQILESVSHIHQHDIVHRDLKVSYHTPEMGMGGPICTVRSKNKTNVFLVFFLFLMFGF